MRLHGPRLTGKLCYPLFRTPVYHPLRTESEATPRRNKVFTEATSLLTPKSALLIGCPGISTSARFPVIWALTPVTKIPNFPKPQVFRIVVTNGKQINDPAWAPLAVGQSAVSMGKKGRAALLLNGRRVIEKSDENCWFLLELSQKF